MTGDETLTYPGEFEVLRGKASCGAMGGSPGQLVLTNYRLQWTPGRFTQASRIAIDLENIVSAEIVRSFRTLFVPTVRIRMQNGATYELHSLQEDIHRVLHLINDYRRRERYRPGKLFEDGP